MSYVFAARIHLTSEKRKQNRLTVCDSIEAFRASINSYCLKILRVKQAEQSQSCSKDFLVGSQRLLKCGHGDIQSVAIGEEYNGRFP